MSKRKRRREQKPKSKDVSYKSGGVWKNDQLSRALNKHFGLPEDFKGDITGFEEAVPIVANTLGATKVEKVPSNEKGYPAK